MRDNDNNDPSTSRIERIVKKVQEHDTERVDAPRLAVVELTQKAHSELLREHAAKLTLHEGKLTAGEVLMGTLATKAENVKHSLEKIESGIGKLVWVVLAAVIAALLHLVITK